MAVKSRTLSKSDTDNRLTLGRRIVDARTATGMTSYRLAQKLRVSRMSVWFWEHDRRTPRYSNLHRLARLLGIPVAAILPDPPEEAATCSR